MVVPKLAGNFQHTFGTIFGTIFGTRKLFFKKTHPCGNPSKYDTSRVLYIPLYPTNSQIFGTKLPKCRRYGITILYRGTQKQAAEVAAISKYFSDSNNRTLDTLKRKSTATLFTIAAAFCSIIIEAHQKKVKG